MRRASFEQAENFLRIEMFNPEQRTASGLIHRKKCKRCIIRGGRKALQGFRAHRREMLRPAALEKRASHGAAQSSEDDRSEEREDDAD